MELDYEKFKRRLSVYGVLLLSYPYFGHVRAKEQGKVSNYKHSSEINSSLGTKNKFVACSPPAERSLRKLVIADNSYSSRSAKTNHLALILSKCIFFRGTLSCISSLSSHESPNIKDKIILSTIQLFLGLFLRVTCK